jgi:hypothetical protein
MSNHYTKSTKTWKCPHFSWDIVVLNKMSRIYSETYVILSVIYRVISSSDGALIRNVDAQSRCNTQSQKWSTATVASFIKNCQKFHMWDAWFCKISKCLSLTLIVININFKILINYHFLYISYVYYFNNFIIYTLQFTITENLENTNNLQLWFHKRIQRTAKVSY